MTELGFSLFLKRNRVPFRDIDTKNNEIHLIVKSITLCSISLQMKLFFFFGFKKMDRILIHID
jgi:hypothetical protein